MDFKQCILLGLSDVGVKDHAIELAQRWNVPHVSMESLIQESISTQTEVGLQVAPYIEAGESIPDELAIKLIRKRLQQPDVMLNGWVVDGFPATITQAEALDKLLVRVGLPTATVVYLKAMTGLLVNRIWTRNKQTETMPIIRQRLAQQEHQLFPLVEYYQRRSQLKTINGSLPFAEVARDLFHLGYSDTGTAPLIKDEAELDSLISKESVLVVDCLASWCGPCKLVAPLIDQLADDYGDRAKVMKMDFDANQQIPERFGLQGMPAVMFFKDGQLQETVTGVKSYQTYSSMVTRFLEASPQA